MQHHMQRLYFLTPNAVSTVSIAHELINLGIRKEHIHIVSNDQVLLDKLIEKLGLAKANVRQTSDIVQAGKRGIIYGTIIGLIAGIIASIFLPVDQPFSIAATILAVTVFGILFGIWSSTLIGVAVEDVKVKKYQKELNKGCMLMLVDIPPEREPQVTALIKQHHPEANIEKVTLSEQRRGEGVGA